MCNQDDRRSANVLLLLNVSAGLEGLHFLHIREQMWSRKKGCKVAASHNSITQMLWLSLHISRRVHANTWTIFKCVRVRVEQLNVLQRYSRALSFLFTASVMNGTAEQQSWCATRARSIQFTVEQGFKVIANSFANCLFFLFFLYSQV